MLGIGYKPFLKWPGGKSWLSKFIAILIESEDYRVYCEPFLGGGAVYFKLAPKEAMLSDSNRELINCYSAVKKNPHLVINYSKSWKNENSCYKYVKKLKPKSMEERAAQFIFLTRTAWGGIYRMNSKGEFNTSFGNSGRLPFNSLIISDCASILKTANVLCMDFEQAIKNSKKDDVIYADPPYISKSEKTKFRRYNENLFSWDDQVRLANICKIKAEQGVRIILSGLWSSELFELFKNWWAIKLHRTSRLSRNPINRREIDEALYVSTRPKNEILNKCKMVKELKRL